MYRLYRCAWVSSKGAEVGLKVSSSQTPQALRKEASFLTNKKEVSLFSELFSQRPAHFSNKFVQKGTSLKLQFRENDTFMQFAWTLRQPTVPCTDDSERCLHAHQITLTILNLKHMIYKWWEKRSFNLHVNKLFQFSIF